MLASGDDTANSSQMKQRLNGNSQVAKQVGNAHVHTRLLSFSFLLPLSHILSHMNEYYSTYHRILW